MKYIIYAKFQWSETTTEKCSMKIDVPNFSKYKEILNGIKVRVFFENNVEKKHLCRQDKNYYYFCKLNIPVINLM